MVSIQHAIHDKSFTLHIFFKNKNKKTHTHKHLLKRFSVQRFPHQIYSNLGQNSVNKSNVREALERYLKSPKLDFHVLHNRFEAMADLPFLRNDCSEGTYSRLSQIRNYKKFINALFKENRIRERSQFILFVTKKVFLTFSGNMKVNHWREMD